MIRRREGRASGRTFELRFETGRMYYPAFRDLLSHEIIGGWSFAVGRVFLGPVHAPFDASLDHWQPLDYERQWRAAASRVVDGPGAALFPTSYRGPGASHHAVWWAQRDGDRVGFRLDDVSGKRLEAYLHTAEAIRMPNRWPMLPARSEAQWTVSVSDIREFLVHGPMSGSHVPG
jgi:hypothetical protein